MAGTRESSAQATTGRGLNITLWVLQALVALGMTFGAIAKFTENEDAMEVFVEMGTDSWLHYTIGVLEILGAIALVVPQLRLYAIAAACFVALTAGAIISHIIWGGNPSGAIIMIVLNAFILWGRRADLKLQLAHWTRRGASA